MLRVKEILKERGLTVQQLADMLQISRVGLSQQINGKPRLDSLEKIANALGVEVVDLFEQKNVPYKCPHCGKPINITLSE